MPRVTTDYDRWRDRPAWNGAIGYSFSDDPDETLPACSMAFPMTKSGGQKILATAGHCSSQYVNHGQIVNAAALDFNQTIWSYDIGTSSGQPNSLCASTGSSCNSAGGGTKRGDLSAFSAPSTAGSIYTGGPKGTTKATVVSAQTGLPAVNDEVCLSAARTGTHCQWYITDNSMAVWVTPSGSTTDEVLFSPLIQATNADWCPQGGDSGGAIYRQVTGGVRASGIQSSAGLYNGDSDCYLYYTHITHAVALLGASVLLG